MKTLKLAKGIKIALVTLFVIVVGIVIVSVLGNHTVQAGLTVCPDCNRVSKFCGRYI